MWNRLIAYARGLARRRQVESEASDELEFHLQQEMDAHLARGMSPSEARRTALRDLGGMTQATEAVRAVRTTWLDGLWRDIRHGIRALGATPAFTIVALAVLTLSIGASTAIFSVVDAVMLRGLPFRDSGRLVTVGEQNLRDAAGPGLNLVAPQNFLDWRAQQTAFTGLAAIGYASISLKAEGGQEPETLEAQAVTADFFPVLGTAPLMGRTFTADNEVNQGAFAVVISYGLWQRRFGGAPDVIGRRLPGQQADFEILGVMPRSFAYPVGATRPTEVWLPNVFRAEDRVRGNDFSYRLQVIARLRDGVSMEQAQAQMDQITRGLAAATPRWFEDRVARVEPLRDYLTRGVRTWMFMLLAAVGFVLLIACVNLATLMLARASARSRELVIRSALGASRWDLVRALLVEGLLLALGGAALGAFGAWLGVEALRAAIPADVPRVATIAIDLRVLATTVAIAIFSGLIFSAVPALQFSRAGGGAGVMRVSRANTPNAGHQWLRGALVTVEVALAVVLLVGAGLFLASFARVASVESRDRSRRCPDRARQAPCRREELGTGTAAQSRAAAKHPRHGAGAAWRRGRGICRWRRAAAGRLPHHRVRHPRPRASARHRRRLQRDLTRLLPRHAGPPAQGPVLYRRRPPGQRAGRHHQRCRRAEALSGRGSDWPNRPVPGSTPSCRHRGQHPARRSGNGLADSGFRAAGAKPGRGRDADDATRARR